MNKYEINVTYDDPISFNGLLIYPIIMRDYFKFHYLATCLLIDKNSVEDGDIADKIKIISMNYLDFLYHTNGDKEDGNFIKLIFLLSLCMKMDIDKINYKIVNNKINLIIGNSEIDGYDFDTIKEIICYQNLLNLPDESIHPFLRKKMEEAEAYKRKLNNVKMASLEDQMIALMISSNLKMEDIYNMTIRKFSKSLERIDHKLHYEIYLSSSLSGMVEWKDKSFIKHWLVDLGKEQFSDVKMTPDDLKEKIGQ